MGCQSPSRDRWPRTARCGGFGQEPRSHLTTSWLRGSYAELKLLGGAALPRTPPGPCARNRYSCRPLRLLPVCCGVRFQRSPRGPGRPDSFAVGVLITCRFLVSVAVGSRSSARDTVPGIFYFRQSISNSRGTRRPAAGGACVHHQPGE
jgi:hypothetical protein